MAYRQGLEGLKIVLVWKALNRIFPHFIAYNTLKKPSHSVLNEPNLEFHRLKESLIRLQKGDG